MKRENLETIYEGKKNVIIDGTMSVGKTVNLGFSFVDKMVDDGSNLLILDSRKEYLNRFYSKLKKEGYEILILNFDDFSKSEGWNLFDYPYELYKSKDIDRATLCLEKIAKEIFFENNNEDSFWINSARDFFVGCCLALFEDGKKEEINLNSIISFLNEDNSNYIEEYFRTKDKTNIAYTCASGTVFSPIETRGGIISTAKQRLTPITSKRGLMQLLSQTTFSFKEIKNKKLAFFLINSEEESILSSLVSIFIQEIFMMLSKNKQEREFDVVLDNFDTIDNISNLKGILSSCISKNIKFYLMTRDRELLENKYSSYINQLTNSISIHSKEIIINVDDDYTKIDNIIPQEYIQEENDILYPTRYTNEIKVFNLKRFMLLKFQSDNEKYKNYTLEEVNYEKYKEVNGENKSLSPQGIAVKEGRAKFYIVKNENKIVDSFVIFLDSNNWITLDLKKFIDVIYTSFIFNTLSNFGYEFVSCFLPNDNENLLNMIKDNFDVIKTENCKQGMFNYKKVTIEV